MRLAAIVGKKGRQLTGDCGVGDAQPELELAAVRIRGEVMIAVSHGLPVRNLPARSVHGSKALCTAL